MQITLWASVLSALCFAGVFASQRSKKLDLLLASTVNGKEQLVRTKLLITATTAVAVGALLYLPELLQVVRFYGLPALSAPACSLETYQTGLFTNLPLGVFVLLDFLGLISGCTVIALFVLWLGCRLHNLVLTILLGGLSLALFPLLEMAGVQGACWLSLYPLFHLANMLRSPSTGVPLLLLGFIWAGIAWLCRDDMLRTFGTSE